MEKNEINELKIDNGFKNLICPLQKNEYLQLEANLLADGCREPIVAWNGFIIDGHNRYEICTRHQIPYAVIEMEFDCREAVIAWICANQLGRRNITEETRRFLIGMQYESEKLAHSLKNVHGKNQYAAPENNSLCEIADSSGNSDCDFSGHVTAQRIAEENHICNGTVQKYAGYTRALETIGQKVPEMVPKILSGRYKISHKNVVELSRLTADEIKKIGRRIERNRQPFIQYSKTRQEVKQTIGSAGPDRIRSAPSVKDMPAFDPDAEITGLSLTIPSWSSSIERTRTNADLSIVSSRAKDKLFQALIDLQQKATNMLSAIKEGE